MDNEISLDELATGYVVNALIFNELKYMIQDFMDDTEEINPQCIERKEEINDLINYIGKTMKKVNPHFDNDENNPFSDYSKEIQRDFSQIRHINFIPLLEDAKGDAIKANHEVIDWYKGILKRRDELKD